MYCTQCGVQLAQGAGFCHGCGTRAPESPPASSLAIEETGRAPASTHDPDATRPKVSYAGFWWRTLAAFIDGVIQQVAVVVAVFPIAFSIGFTQAEETGDVAAGLYFLLGPIVNWLYFTISESSSWQATLGKKMLGLYVTDERRQRLSFGRANGRLWSKFISGLLLGIGFLMVGFTKRKQGLHDQIAGTLVFRRTPSIALEPTTDP